MVKHIKVKHYLRVIRIKSLCKIDCFFTVWELEAERIGCRCEGDDWKELSTVEKKKGLAYFQKIEQRTSIELTLTE